MRVRPPSPRRSWQLAGRIPTKSGLQWPHRGEARACWGQVRTVYPWPPMWGLRSSPQFQQEDTCEKVGTGIGDFHRGGIDVEVDASD